MAKNKLTEILTSPDKLMKKTSGPNGILSRLFRQILLDLNIGPARFASLLQDYINDVRNCIPDNRKDRTSSRGNMTKEFSRPQMTWRVFCKALRFLQIKKIEFVIKAHHANGKATLHSTVVDFGSRRDLQTFEENLEQHEDCEEVPYVQCLETEAEDLTTKLIAQIKKDIKND